MFFISLQILQIFQLFLNKNLFYDILLKINLELYFSFNVKMIFNKNLHLNY